MAWTTPRTWVAGETLTAALFNTHIRDNLLVMSGAWTPYSPIITTGGTAITLNNGTLDAAYKMMGDKTVFFRVTLIVGSTTVLPAGVWVIPLPVAALTANRNVGDLISLAPNRQGGWINSATTSVSLYEGGTSTVATVASLGTVSGTTLTLSGHYEGA